MGHQFTSATWFLTELSFLSGCTVEFEAVLLERPEKAGAQSRRERYLCCRKGRTRQAHENNIRTPWIGAVQRQTKEPCSALNGCRTFVLAKWELGLKLEDTNNILVEIQDRGKVN